ncbi:MAG: metallophosphoesterase family protein, partial [Xanthomonadales bacterium]|nr:metallophosphoesterase family protein [Xanthomonadales bacterium]
MFDRLRGARAEAVAPAYPPGKRMYCVGDIHGRADLLAELHGQIQRDAAAYDGQCQVLYLGDYIDRGEQSRQVLELLLEQPLAGFEHFHLLGNHERAVLDFLVDPVAMAGWLVWGGRATLYSYGIHAGPMPSRDELRALRDGLDAKLPDAHRDFLENCLPAHAEGSYYFVHAGVRPGVTLDRQELGDQLWIRDEFTRSTANHGAIVVHGHSISEQAELLPNRIGIDTGAFYSGVLT